MIGRDWGAGMCENDERGYGESEVMLLGFVPLPSLRASKSSKHYTL